MMGPSAAEKRVTIEVMVDPAIPLVYADPDRALEVLINLIDNAIKFTPAEGSVIVKASMVETDPSSVYLSISDTGRGIPQDALPRVFERLYQDPDGVDNNRSGLGLGLYIARGIVTLHGGRMWVASEPGSGSTFSFTLPLYSLAKLLLPVISHQGQLRKELVLVRVELTPLTQSLRGGWKDTSERCLEILRKCIFIDKDLVLPPTGNSGLVQTFFVLASTNMERVTVLMDRICDQVGKLPQLKASGKMRVMAEAIPAAPTGDARTLEQQVRGVADYVSQVIQQGLWTKSNSDSDFSFTANPSSDRNSNSNDKEQSTNA
jgi:hypothetical protein